MKNIYLYKILFAFLCLGVVGQVSGQLIISEVMYNPCTAQGNDADCEYLEIYNSYTNDVDLTGFSISGVGTASSNFNGISIASGDYLVISIGTTDCVDYDLNVVADITTFSGSNNLNNTGETISLTDCAGTVVGSASYVVGDGANGDCNSLHNDGNNVFSGSTPTPGMGILSVGSIAYAPAFDIEVASMCSATDDNSWSIVINSISGGIGPYDLSYTPDGGSLTTVNAVSVGQVISGIPYGAANDQDAIEITITDTGAGCTTTAQVFELNCLDLTDCDCSASPQFTTINAQAAGNADGYSMVYILSDNTNGNTFVSYNQSGTFAGLSANNGYTVYAFNVLTTELAIFTTALDAFTAATVIANDGTDTSGGLLGDGADAGAFNGLCYTTESFAYTCDCPVCPDFTTIATDDLDAQITNSTCTAGTSTIVDGTIAAPTTACPANSTLQYSIDNSNWSTDLPMYDNTMAQTIYTRCQCDSDPTMLSAVDEITTAPANNNFMILANPVCDGANTSTFDIDLQIMNGTAGATYQISAGGSEFTTLTAQTDAATITIQDVTFVAQNTKITITVQDEATGCAVDYDVLQLNCAEAESCDCSASGSYSINAQTTGNGNGFSMVYVIVNNDNSNMTIGASNQTGQFTGLADNTNYTVYKFNVADAELVAFQAAVDGLTTIASGDDVLSQTGAFATFCYSDCEEAFIEDCMCCSTEAGTLSTDDCIALCATGISLTDMTVVDGQTVEVDVDFADPTTNPPVGFDYAFIIVDASGNIVGIHDATLYNSATPADFLNEPVDIPNTLSSGAYTIYGVSFDPQDTDLNSIYGITNSADVNLEGNTTVMGQSFADFQANFVLINGATGTGLICGDVDTDGTVFNIMAPITIDAQVTCTPVTNPGDGGDLDLTSDPNDFYIEITAVNGGHGSVTDWNIAASSGATSLTGTFSGATLQLGPFNLADGTVTITATENTGAPTDCTACTGTAELEAVPCPAAVDLCDCTADNFPTNAAGIISAPAQHSTTQYYNMTSYQYVLVDRTVGSGTENQVLAVNTTGLFTDLANGDYEVFAFNILDTDIASFLAMVTVGSTYSTPTTACIGACGSGTYAINCFCCMADAGNIIRPAGGEVDAVTGNQTICIGDDLDAFQNDYTETDETDPDATDYETTYLLTDAAGMILQVAADGNFDFALLGVGTYDIYVLNYSTQNIETTVLAYLAQLAGGMADGTGGNVSEIVTDDDDISSGGPGTGAFCLDLDNLDNDDIDSASDAVQVTIVPLPVATVNDPSVCAGATSAPLMYTETVGTATMFSIDYDAAAEGQGFQDVVSTSTLPSTYVIPAGAVAGTYNGTISYTTADGCTGTDAFTITINAAILVEAGNPITVCASSTVDLTTLGASLTGTSTAMWTTSGTGTFDDGNAGVFGTATSYTPSAADYTAGSVTLTLSSTGAVAPCTDDSDTVTISLNNVDCNSFPWNGQNE